MGTGLVVLPPVPDGSMAVRDVCLCGLSGPSGRSVDDEAAYRTDNARRSEQSRDE